MDKKIKILIGVVILLGIISGAFLLFGRKTATPIAAPKTIQATAPVKSLDPLPVDVATPKSSDSTQGTGLPQVETPKAKTPRVSPQDQAKSAAEQWAQCKVKTMSTTTNLFWKVQITEGIPAGGTYAKGNLNGDAALPVHAIIKSDSTIVDKIKAMLVVGKTAFLRGTCTEVAADGSVVLQAF